MQLQSEQPKPATDSLLSPKNLAVSHSSAFSASLKKTLMIFAAGLSSK